jgi:hypothetical protein
VALAYAITIHKLKEGGTFVGVMAELVAEDPQGIVGAAEAAGDLGAGQLPE